MRNLREYNINEIRRIYMYIFNYRLQSVNNLYTRKNGSTRKLKAANIVM